MATLIVSNDENVQNAQLLKNNKSDIFRRDIR